MPRRLRVISGLGLLVVLLAAWTGATAPVKGPHSALELGVLRSQLQGLDVQFGNWFVTAGRCAGCHGHDSLGIAMVAAEGEDVNVVNDWRSTMMANSARDPFFLAKMEHEGLVNPAYQAQMEHTCLKCHAPLAVFEAQLNGAPPFTMANFDTSVFARDGVSCLACHMQDPDSAAHFFSGDLHFDSARVWGPYTQAQINPAIMQYFVGYTPDQGAHILDGRVCAGCHTAINHGQDLGGQPTGDSFFEQTMWQEYENSVYYGSDQNCRSCHMPRIQDSVVLAADYIFLTGQSPFGKHHLTGGGTFMLKLMQAHIADLDIPATAVEFDSTMARSRAHLRNSVEMAVDVDARTADTLFARVDLTNIIGHKFPSGFPNRRAFLQVVALGSGGDTLFRSGMLDADHEVLGNDLPYEPHHDVITQEGQVQIYEMVMADVNGAVTTTLLRAASKLKDNRLVPIGFSTSHPSYDTAAIAGLALSDPDFNHDALGTEGDGGDVVHYHIPVNGYNGPIDLKVKLWFQQVPPRWNQEMFAFHGPRIDTFRTMVQDADGTPDLVAADSVMGITLGMDDLHGMALQALPNPTRDGMLLVEGPGIQDITAHDAAGRKVPLATSRVAGSWRCRLPDGPGLYYLVVRTLQGKRLLRVVRTGD